MSTFLVALLGDTMLAPVVAVCVTRYAADTDRLALDLAAATDTGKTLAADVLEHKTISTPAGTKSQRQGGRRER